MAAVAAHGDGVPRTQGPACGHAHAHACAFTRSRGQARARTRFRARTETYARSNTCARHGARNPAESS